MPSYAEPDRKQAAQSAELDQADGADSWWSGLIGEDYWQGEDLQARSRGRRAGPLSSRAYKALAKALKGNEDTRILDRDQYRSKIVEVLAPLLDKNETVLAGFESGCVKLSILGPTFALTELEGFIDKKGGVGVDPSDHDRGWDVQRGVTRHQSNRMNSHVVFNEENLMGYDAPQHKLLPGVEPMAKGYSTLTHEFAHGLHHSKALREVDVSDLGEYSDVDDMISKCFKNVVQGIDIVYADDQQGRYCYCFVPSDWPTADVQSDLPRLIEALWFGHVDGPCFSAKINFADRVYVQGSQGDIARLPAVYGMPTVCYSSSNESEYFAQSVNCYLGTNTGFDTGTGRTRNNGAAWLEQNDPQMFTLLDRLFARGTDRAVVRNANPRGEI